MVEWWLSSLANNSKSLARLVVVTETRARLVQSISLLDTHPSHFSTVRKAGQGGRGCATRTAFVKASTLSDLQEIDKSLFPATTNARNLVPRFLVTASSNRLVFLIFSLHMRPRA